MSHAVLPDGVPHTMVKSPQLQGPILVSTSRFGNIKLSETDELCRTSGCRVQHNTAGQAKRNRPHVRPIKQRRHRSSSSFVARNN
eukprot:m.82569 g.82569  ORF g.82569 m.82569 type:complete len:85 (+) comp11113_c0_seq3:554-808(+)